MEHLINFIKLFTVSDIFSLIAAGYAIFFHLSGWVEKKFTKFTYEINKDITRLCERADKHDRKMEKLEERWERQSREFDKKFWALYKEMHRIGKDLEKF